MREQFKHSWTPQAKKQAQSTNMVKYSFYLRSIDAPRPNTRFRYHHLHAHLLPEQRFNGRTGGHDPSLPDSSGVYPAGRQHVHQDLPHTRGKQGSRNYHGPAVVIVYVGIRTFLLRIFAVVQALLF